MKNLFVFVMLMFSTSICIGQDASDLTDDVYLRSANIKLTAKKAVGQNAPTKNGAKVIVFIDRQSKEKTTEELPSRLLAAINDSLIVSDSVIYRDTLNTGYYLNGFKGNKADYAFAERIRKFHNPKFRIFIGDPAYQDIYTLNAEDWNVYIEDSYAYVTPTWTNPFWWNYHTRPFAFDNYNYGFYNNYYPYNSWYNWNYPYCGPYGLNYYSSWNYGGWGMYPYDYGFYGYYGYYGYNGYYDYYPYSYNNWGWGGNYYSASAKQNYANSENSRREQSNSTTSRYGNRTAYVDAQVINSGTRNEFSRTGYTMLSGSRGETNLPSGISRSGSRYSSAMTSTSTVSNTVRSVGTRNSESLSAFDRFTTSGTGTRSTLSNTPVDTRPRTTNSSYSNTPYSTTSRTFTATNDVYRSSSSSSSGRISQVPGQTFQTGSRQSTYSSSNVSGANARPNVSYDNRGSSSSSSSYTPSYSSPSYSGGGSSSSGGSYSGGGGGSSRGSDGGGSSAGSRR